MKVTSVLLLSAVAEAAVIAPRQFGGLGSLFGGGFKVVDVKKMTPEVRPEATRLIQRIGPLKLSGKGMSADSGQQNFMLQIPSNALCRDCTVLKGHVGLADAQGVPISPRKDSGVYIHHILTYDTTKSQKAFVSGCGGGLAGGILGSKFIGSGEDNNNVPVWYTNKDGSHLGGFHIGSNDRFFMNADLVSLNSGSTEVFLTFEIEYLPGIKGSDSRETLLSVDVCGGQRLSPSTSGQTISKSMRYSFTENGKIVLAKGHLHAGGEKVEIFINNKLACESKALYGGIKGPMAINEMTICPEIKVKAGDSMTFNVVYDASKHPLRHEMGIMPDVMGMLDIVFSQ